HRALIDPLEEPAGGRVAGDDLLAGDELGEVGDVVHRPLDAPLLPMAAVAVRLEDLLRLGRQRLLLGVGGGRGKPDRQQQAGGARESLGGQRDSSTRVPAGETYLPLGPFGISLKRPSAEGTEGRARVPTLSDVPEPAADCHRESVTTR